MLMIHAAEEIIAQGGNSSLGVAGLEVHPSIHPLSVTALSLLWGRRIFVEANPSCLWVKAGYSLDKLPVHHRWQRPPCKVPTVQQEQCGVQYLAQGHFDMQLSSPAHQLTSSATFRSLAGLLYPLTYSRPFDWNSAPKKTKMCQNSVLVQTHCFYWNM